MVKLLKEAITLKTTDLLVQQCSKCSEIVIAGFPLQCEWKREGDMVITKKECKCGGEIVWQYEIEKEMMT